MWKNGIDERQWASKRLAHHLHKYFRRYKCIGDEDRDPTILRIMNPSSIFKSHIVNTYKPFNRGIDGYYLMGGCYFDIFCNKWYWEATFEECPHLLRYAFAKSIGIKEIYCTPIYSAKRDIKRANQQSTDNEHVRHSSTLQILDCINRNKRYYPSDGEFGGDTMSVVPVKRPFVPKGYCSIEPPLPNESEYYSLMNKIRKRVIAEVHGEANQNQGTIMDQIRRLALAGTGVPEKFVSGDNVLDISYIPKLMHTLPCDSDSPNDTSNSGEGGKSDDGETPNETKV